MSGQDATRLATRAAHARNIGALLTRAAYRVEVHGRHHVPAHGAVILLAQQLDLVEAAVVASVANRPIHTLAPGALASMGDIAVISPGIVAARWARALLKDGAAIMVTGDEPPMGYLLAHGPVLVIPVVVIGSPGKAETGPRRWRPKIQVYFCAPSTIAVTTRDWGPVDPCSLRVVQDLGERARQLAANARNESGRRSGLPATGEGHQ